MLVLFTNEAFYKYFDPTQYPPVDLIPLLTLMGLVCIINYSRLLSDCAKKLTESYKVRVWMQNMNSFVI